MNQASHVFRVMFGLPLAKVHCFGTMSALHMRPVRLVVRTPGFHPGNRGSIPLRATVF